MEYIAIGIDNHIGVLGKMVRDYQLAANQEEIVRKFNSGQFAEANFLANKAFDEAVITKDGRFRVLEMLQETKFTTLIFLLTDRMEKSYKSGNKEEARRNWSELKNIFHRPDLGKIFYGMYVFKYPAKLKEIFSKYDDLLLKETTELYILIRDSSN